MLMNSKRDERMVKKILVAIGLVPLFAFTFYVVLGLIGMWILPNSTVCWKESNIAIRTIEILAGIVGMTTWLYVIKKLSEEAD